MPGSKLRSAHSLHSSTNAKIQEVRVEDALQALAGFPTNGVEILASVGHPNMPRSIHSLWLTPRSIGTSNAIKSLSLRDKPQEDDTKLEVDKSKFQPTEANAEAHDVEAEYKELRLRFVALEETATNTDREKVELVRQVKRLEDNQIDLQERLSNVTAEHTEIQQKNHEMRKTLQDGQADNQKLREQITQWKVAISASTQSEDEVADDTIAMKMDEIFYKIQGFVVKHFRGTTFSMSSLFALSLFAD